MSKRLASVPLQQIRRLQLYINTGRKSVSAIRAETGAAYVLNGGLYNMGTFQPLCHLRAEGVTYAKDPYSYFGYLWDDGPDLQMGLVPDESFHNYLCCVELIRQGKPAVPADLQRRHGGQPAALGHGDERRLPVPVRQLRRHDAGGLAGLPDGPGLG